MLPCLKPTLAFEISAISHKERIGDRELSHLYKLPVLSGTMTIHTDVCVIVCCAELLSCAQLFVTPWTVAHQAPLSMEILQARILERLPCPSPGNVPQPRDQTQVSPIAGRFFTV